MTDVDHTGRSYYGDTKLYLSDIYEGTSNQITLGASRLTVVDSVNSISVLCIQMDRYTALIGTPKRESLPLYMVQCLQVRPYIISRARKCTTLGNLDIIMLNSTIRERTCFSLDSEISSEIL